MKGFLTEYKLVKKSAHWWQNNEYEKVYKPIEIIGSGRRVCGETHKYPGREFYLITDGGKQWEIDAMYVIKEEK
jgi:hypothetical protein